MLWGEVERGRPESRAQTLYMSFSPPYVLHKHDITLQKLGRQSQNSREWHLIKPCRSSLSKLGLSSNSSQILYAYILHSRLHTWPPIVTLSMFSSLVDIMKSMVDKSSGVGCPGPLNRTRPAGVIYNDSVSTATYRPGLNNTMIRSKG